MVRAIHRLRLTKPPTLFNLPQNKSDLFSRGRIYPSLAPSFPPLLSPPRCLSSSQCMANAWGSSVRSRSALQFVVS